MHDCVLFATLGQTDLQVIVPTAAGDGRRVSVAKMATRAVHEYWLHSGDAFELPVNAQTPKTEDAQSHAELGADAGRLTIVGSGASSTCPDEPVQLAPTLLGPVVTELVSSRKQQVRAVVLFTSSRDDPGFAQRDAEPVAAGPILAKWLSGVFGLACAEGPDEPPAEGKAVWINAVRGREDIERDQLAMAKRFGEAVRTAAQECPGCVGVVSDTGGFPALRDTLRSCVAWRFGSRVVRMRRNRVSGRAEIVRYDEALPPLELIQAAHRTCDLIRQGDFAGAAGVASLVEPRHDVEAGLRLLEEKWGSPRRPAEWDTGGGPGILWPAAVKATSLHFSGYGGQAEQRVNGLPEELCFRQTLLGLLTPDLPQCAPIAMRAEACLWRPDHDVVQAAVLTATFAEVAMKELADRAYCLAGQRSCIDLERGRFYPNRSILSADEITRAAQQRKKWHSPLVREDDDGEGWVDIRALQDVILVGPPSPTERETFRLALRELVHAMFCGDETPQSLRNRFIHSAAEEEDIEKVKELMKQQGMWRLDEEGFGMRLLGATRPRKILTALGVADPPGLYRELVQSLLDLIENDPFPPARS